MNDIDRKVGSIIFKLKQVRECKGISQLELSFKAGVSQTMISQVESGKKIPTLTTFVKLCTALDVQPEMMVSDDKRKDISIEREEAKKTIKELIDKWM